MTPLYKIFAFALLSLCLMAELNSQDTIALDLNLLQAPQSPAATMLGIADSEISRPSDPTSFMASLRQAGQDIVGGPTQYAVDFAPAWLFGSNKISAQSFLSNNPRYNIPQSLVVSLAVNNENVTSSAGVSVPNTALAFGMKFSILRGNISSNTKSQINKSLQYLQLWNKDFSNLLETEQANSPEWQRIDSMLSNPTITDALTQAQKDSLETAAGQVLAQLTANVTSQIQSVSSGTLDTLQDISRNINFNRVGFKLDFNSAIAYDFPDQVYGDGKLSDLGLWLTAAIEGQTGWSFLGIARYLYSPDQLFADPTGQISTMDNETFDAGVRLIFSKDKFSFSGEIVNRSVLGNDDIDSTIKYAFNTEYVVSNNTKLTLSIGKAFNGAITRTGNVIAALNFLKGFGSTRTVANQK